MFGTCHRHEESRHRSPLRFQRTSSTRHARIDIPIVRRSFNGHLQSLERRQKGPVSFVDRPFRFGIAPIAAGVRRTVRLEGIARENERIHQASERRKKNRARKYFVFSLLNSNNNNKVNLRHQTIGDVSAGCLRRSCNSHNLATLQAEVPSDWITKLDPWQLTLFQTARMKRQCKHAASRNVDLLSGQ